MGEKNSVGDKVRLVRESRKLSVAQLAERAGLPMEAVGRIESGSPIPSLGPLIRLARALGVRLGTFLDDQENVGPVFVHAGERRRVMHVSDKSDSVRSDLDFFSLAANKAGRHMEPFLIDIYPSSAEDAQLSAHEGEEFIYVLSGEIEEYLLRTEGIRDIQVAGIASPKFGEEVGAFVIRKDGATITEEDVRDFCRGTIANFKVPKYVFCVNSYPMTASGKIQKYKRREMGLALLKESGIEPV